MISLSTKMYYVLKPLLPHRLRLFMRKTRARILLPRYKDQWPIDVSAGSAPVGWQGWPEGKKFAVVLTHDVEWQAGHDTCHNFCTVEEEKGFRSAFYFVPHRYSVSEDLRNDLTTRGFEVGVHGLKHDGKLYSSREVFTQRAKEINQYIKEWGACGFRSPAVHHNLDWIGELEIEYDASTFDTDPLQPQPDGLKKIFPLWIPPNGKSRGYVELPYTLAQDWKVFSILKEKNIDIWKQKLDWIAEQGGMALLITHPDYIQFGDRKKEIWDYPAERYAELLDYINEKYEGQFWQALPKEMAEFWAKYPQKEEDYKVWKKKCGPEAGIA